MLSDAAVKLQEGKARLAGAGDDERLLGMALMSLHGALEEHFREQLAREIVAETQSRPGWVELVDLWQKHRVLSPEDRSLILRTNSKRNQIAHGDLFHLSRSEVERYAQFAQNFMGVRTRPSRRWSKVEEAVVWDDPGVRGEESSGWSPFQSPFWSALFAPLRSSSQSTQPSTEPPTPQPPTLQLDTIVPRLQQQAGWMVKMAVVAALVLVSFWFWNSWLVSVGVTAVILYLVQQRSWLRAGYVYVAGLVYGYVTAGLGLATAVALAAALLWPLAAGVYYFTDGTMALPEAELVVPTIEQLDEVMEGEFITTTPEEATAVPAAEPTSSLQIQVQGNSNIRAEPNTTAVVLEIVADGARFDVLDVNADRTWYKIQLESGQEGWIGSSRVVEDAP